MAESLESLESMRSSFIANVSHDLRTPMTTIAGFIDGIRDGVIPESERDHYLELVSLEIRRLSRLVASLLDLSRIQAGERKFVFAPFDVCEMARRILLSFENKIDFVRYLKDYADEQLELMDEDELDEDDFDGFEEVYEEDDAFEDDDN
jgi:signal transduction histidine kinase